MLQWFGASTCRQSRSETLLPCSVGHVEWVLQMFGYNLKPNCPISLLQVQVSDTTMLN